MKVKLLITLNFKKGREYILDFVRDGYEKKTYRLGYSVGAGWIILDILSGIIGIIIDAATGNWNDFNVDAYKAILDPVSK